MLSALLVGAGGFAGAIARYWLSTTAQRLCPGFPLGTLLVNVLGCLAIGVLMALAEEGRWVSEQTRLLLVAGVLGGFTTFSAFGWETVHLLGEQRYGVAAASVLGNVALGIGAVALGRMLAIGAG